MKKIILFALVLMVSVWCRSALAEDDHVARGIVIQALIPNKLNVGGSEFKTIQNPRGEGVLVYDPRTSFYGVKRNLMWIVLDDVAYPLNGSSKEITPGLQWPREAPVKTWEKTGLDPYSATDAIKLIFKE